MFESILLRPRPRLRNQDTAKVLTSKRLRDLIFDKLMAGRMIKRAAALQARQHRGQACRRRCRESLMRHKRRMLAPTTRSRVAEACVQRERVMARWCVQLEYVERDERRRFSIRDPGTLRTRVLPPCAIARQQLRTERPPRFQPSIRLLPAFWKMSCQDMDGWSAVPCHETLFLLIAALGRRPPARVHTSAVAADSSSLVTSVCSAEVERGQQHGSSELTVIEMCRTREEQYRVGCEVATITRRWTAAWKLATDAAVCLVMHTSRSLAYGQRSERSGQGQALRRSFWRRRGRRTTDEQGCGSLKRSPFAFAAIGSGHRRVLTLVLLLRYDGR